MHQVEKLQSYFRLSPSKPNLEEAYFPTPYLNYLLIFNDSSIQANDYSYFADVAEYLLSADPSINIVQVINSPNGERLPGVFHVDQLSHNNLYSLVKNADLVLCSDQFCTELCGIYDKPMVRLSGNSSKNTSRPFFNKEELHIVFSTEEQPSYSAVEPQKNINKILPEDIARASLKQLNIKDPTPLHKTLYTGSLYRQYFLDYVPDFKLEHNVSGNQPITVRLDLENNLENVAALCSHSNVHTLSLDREIDIESLLPFKNTLHSIAIEVKLDLSLDFIKEIHKLGMEIVLYTKDKDNLNDLRLKFIDWVVRFLNPKEKPNLPTEKQLFYKSTKLTFSKNQKFPSLAARECNISNNKIIDNKSFWEESDYFLIYSLD
tara:strand:- start:656 stop:1783 length:1128 start_codon:yes stop_codon:yes gene_type:complete